MKLKATALLTQWKLLRPNISMKSIFKKILGKLSKNEDENIGISRKQLINENKIEDINWSKPILVNLGSDNPDSYLESNQLLPKDSTHTEEEQKTTNNQDDPHELPIAFTKNDDTKIITFSQVPKVPLPQSNPLELNEKIESNEIILKEEIEKSKSGIDAMKLLMQSVPSPSQNEDEDPCPVQETPTEENKDKKSLESGDKAINYKTGNRYGDKSSTYFLLFNCLFRSKAGATAVL